MDPVRNPFAPGAGNKPPELAGRQAIIDDARIAVQRALIGALRSFASAFKFEYGNVSIAVEPEIGVADSGDMENDLPELFFRIGEAAQAAGKAWTLLIDEVQYLGQKDLAALIVCLHKISQENLPVLFFVAGLPQVAALSGHAKSYAERLFHFPEVGALSEEDAREAIRQPVHDEHAVIDDAALNEIVSKTQGYPYFLQEWGHQSWNIAEGDTITLQDARRAEAKTLKRLDEGFFKVRCSPAHGDIAFTVPMFNEYLLRNLVAIENI